MRTFELKPDYQLLYTTLGAPIIIMGLLFAKTTKVSTEPFDWWPNLYVVILILVLIAIFFGVYRAFRKETVCVDGDSIAIDSNYFPYRKIKIYSQNIDKITYFKDRMEIHSHKRLQKRLECKRFKNSDWDEFVVQMRGLKQFPS